LVEIAASPEVPVCLVDRVKEVGAHDEDVDAPSVLYESWGSGLRFWVAGAYRNTVVEALYPSCNELGVCQYLFVANTSCCTENSRGMLR
jgi:hypothetical protein